MSEIDFSYISLFNSTQIFVDAIRNSGGLNEKRFLIIPEMYTENELNIFYYDFILPEDPANKTAISFHYFFPSEDITFSNGLEW